MKKLLLIIVASTGILSLNAQNVNIPDNNFKTYLLNNPLINTVDDGEISVEEAQAFTETIDITGLSVADFTGLEAFINLTIFKGAANSATSIDVSSNVELTRLELYNTPLAALDVSQNTKLDYLQFGKTSTFSTIDLTNNALLRILNCPNTPAITTILGTDILTNVDYFYIQGCSIDSLDLSKCIDLNQLRAQNNNLSFLNVRNGHNEVINLFEIQNNPGLTCVSVDNPAYSDTTWTNKDAGTQYVVYCDPNEAVHIPDSNFKAYLVADNNIDINMDDEISYGEAASFTGTINCPSLDIADLTGIEAFTSIIGLTCHSNQITSVDLSANTSLVSLRINNNLLTSLDLTANTSLTSLECQDNDLTSLNVTNNTLLEKLWCYSNDLTTLDVSTLTALENFYCYENDLTVLDVSTNVLLEKLRCNSNNLTALDVSTNTALVDLYCLRNDISELDVSTNTALINLSIGNNPIETLDVSTNTALVFLHCYDNELSSLNLTTNTLLERLYCYDNQLSELDLTAQVNLTTLECHDNVLTSLNVKNGNNSNVTDIKFKATGNADLRCINVDDSVYSASTWTTIDEGVIFIENGICPCFIDIPDANFKAALVANDNIDTDFDDEISCDEAMSYTGTINVDNQGISDLTGIEAFINIASLRADDNSLTNVDVSQNIELISLYLNSNSLTAIDVTNNTKLDVLDIATNPDIITLDLTQNTALRRIVANQLNLNALDLSQNISLEYLWMSSTELASIDLSNNLILKDIRIGGGELEALDVSMLPLLTVLSVENNNLSSLNVKNGTNTTITTFFATNNPNLFCIEVDDPAYSEANWTVVDEGVTFSTECVLGLEEGKNSIQFLYPNPASDLLIVESLVNTSYQIQNQLGESIINGTLQKGTNSVDVNSLEGGMYVLIMTNASSKHFVKQ